MIALNIEIAGDFFEGRKHPQPIRMDIHEARAKREVRINLLIPSEGLIENLQRTLDNGAALILVDVSGVDDAVARAGLWTGTVTLDAFTVLSHLVGRTCANASAIILQ